LPSETLDLLVNVVSGRHSKPRRTGAYCLSRPVGAMRSRV